MPVPIAERGTEVVAVFALFMALSTLTVGLRIYCRMCLVKELNWCRWSDILAIASWVIFMAYSACAIAGPQYGAGQHTIDIFGAGGTLQDVSTALKLWWICEPLYAISTMLIKTSIAIVFLNITTRRTLKLATYITLGISLITGVVFFFYFIFQCAPPSYFWTRLAGTPGSCLSTNTTISIVYAYSAVTCVGDFAFAIIPWFLLADLKVKTSQKVMVAAVISLGTVASFATIARLPYIKNLREEDDFLYAAIDVALWTCVENGLGITAACAATLRPLARLCLGKLSESGWSSSHTTHAKEMDDNSETRRTDSDQTNDTEKGFALQEILRVDH